MELIAVLCFFFFPLSVSLVEPLSELWVFSDPGARQKDAASSSGALRVICAAREIKELGENFNSRQLSEESDASRRRLFCLAASAGGGGGGGVKRLTKNFWEGRGGRRRFVTGCLKKCKRGSLFIIQRARKRVGLSGTSISACTRSSLRRLARRKETKGPSKTISTRKRWAKVSLSPKKDKECWLF